MSERVVIYTDGACKGNPGPGGWGAWLRWGAHEKELFGGEPANLLRVKLNTGKRDVREFDAG